MSGPNPSNPGVLAWRTLYTAGIGILAILSLFVLDTVKDTSKAVIDMQSKLSTLTGVTATRLDNHENRLGKLEDWRLGGNR